MASGEGGELVVLFDIASQLPGGGTCAWGAQRRYREFSKLHRLLHLQYPHLLGDELSSESTLPAFPRKHLFRAGWDPQVVTERVAKLGHWLGAVADRLQFASLELVSFLNVPLYAAIRMLSGDLQVTSCSQHSRSAPLITCAA